MNTYCTKCNSTTQMSRSGFADSSKKQRWSCGGCGYRTTNPSPEPNVSSTTVFTKPNSKARRFIITGAQNNTSVNELALASVRQDVKLNQSELVVIPCPYIHPEQQEVWYDSCLSGLLKNERFDIGQYLTVFADVSILPSAVTPLSGFDSIAKGKSGIFGHSKKHLKCLPTSKYATPAIQQTTGFITEPNYIQKKSGQKAEFHHSPGAVVVEVHDSGKFHMRSISFNDDGSYTDLDKVYTPDGVVKAEPALGIVFGDVHHAHYNDEAWTAYFNQLHSVINPKAAVLHDVLDASGFSPHRYKDAIELILSRDKDYKAEVYQAAQWVRSMSMAFDEVCLVPSNHDDMLDRFIKNDDWKDLTLDNAKFYIEMAGRLLDGEVGLFAGIVNELAPKVITPSLDQSYKVGGFECGMHGHLGANGSRNQGVFSKMDTKCITGHTHVPARLNGHLCVGQMGKDDHGYNRGPSSWMISNVIIYADGHATNIHFIDGEWL